jgi:hypothetical protein
MSTCSSRSPIRQRRASPSSPAVQLVRLQDAERTPSLMADALEQGRVLVDRDGEWPALKSGATTWRRRADADDVPLERAMPDLELS